MTRTRVLTFLLLTTLACSDSSGPQGGLCTHGVAINVSSGTSPTFTWAPSCLVLALLVEDNQGSDQWFIEPTSDQGGIASGVVYGSLPDGATQDFPATPLVAGSPYEVIVFFGSRTNPDLTVKSFTP